MNTSSIEACFPPRSRKVKSFCSVLITKSELEAAQQNNQSIVRPEIIHVQSVVVLMSHRILTLLFPAAWLHLDRELCRLRVLRRFRRPCSSYGPPRQLLIIRNFFNIIISINRIGRGLTGGTKCQAMCLHGFRSIAKERSTPQHEVPLQRPR